MKDERRAVEAGLRALRAGLDSIEPTMDADAAVELARRGAERERVAGSARGHTGDGWLRRASGALAALVPPRRLRWALPTLACVSLAAIAVGYAATRPPAPLPTIVRIGAEALPAGRPPARGGTVPVRDPAAVPTTAGQSPTGPIGTLARRLPDPEGESDSGFSIAAPDSGRVAVFQTSNPRIRVVWFYGDASED